MKQMCPWKFLLSLSVVTELLEDKQLAKLGGVDTSKMYLLSWTLLLLFPLIFVWFWIQLTWTDAIFSRIALVSCFCAEIQLSGKNPENRKTPYFHRKLTEPEGEEQESPEWARKGPGAGPGLAVPGLCLAVSGTSSVSPRGYMRLVTWNLRGFSKFF